MVAIINKVYTVFELEKLSRLLAHLAMTKIYRVLMNLILYAKRFNYVFAKSSVRYIRKEWLKVVKGKICFDINALL